jgi:glycosyltransferase involved in cell wall biosynthesis
MSKLPLISVIVPVYNASPTLSLCLNSLEKLDYPKSKLEIIVVDNGSTDGSDKIAKEFNVRLYYERSLKSSYQARNTGITNATGDLIAFTDSDCIVSHDWLINLTRFWDDDKIGCFAGEILSYEPRTLIEKFSDRHEIMKQVGARSHPYMPYTATANSSYRKDVFSKIGYFNPRLVSGGDADFSWRMQNETSLKIKFIPEAVVYHRHRTNVIELYKQFKKNEYGQVLLNQLYPNMKLKTENERKSEFIRAIYSSIRWLPGNLIRFVRGERDFLTLMSPFIYIIASFGTYMGRLSEVDVQ